MATPQLLVFNEEITAVTPFLPLDLQHEYVEEIFPVMKAIPHIASELNKSRAPRCPEDHFTIKTHLWMWQKLVSYFIPSIAEISKMESAQTTVAIHGITDLI